MKKLLLLFLVFSFAISCKSQIYPLRTFSQIPQNAYLKDTYNELNAYEGTWKTTWDNKIIYLTLSKVTNKYDEVFNYYRDYLIAKFKVVNNSGVVIFDNTSLSDEDAKIEGGKFRKVDGKYSLNYLDADLCGITGYITISFVDSTKTQLQWIYSKDNDWIDTDCFYWGKPASERPEPLPYNAILVRQ